MGKITEWAAKQTWKAVAAGLDAIDCEVTADLIRNAVGDAVDLSYSDGDVVVKKIKQSAAYEGLLEKVEAALKNSVQIGRTFSMQFNSRDNLDLYGGLHGVSAWVIATKSANGRQITLDITITDTYDFDYNDLELFKKDKSFMNKLGDFANNLAYSDQLVGVINTFDIKIKMSDKIYI